MDFRKERRGLLINLIEEASEVSQIAAKCLRFGIHNYNPNDPEQTENSELLAKEIGNFMHIVDRLIGGKHIDGIDVYDGEEEKRLRLEKYPLIIDEVTD